MTSSSAEMKHACCHIVVISVYTHAHTQSGVAPLIRPALSFDSSTFSTLNKILERPRRVCETLRQELNDLSLTASQQ